MALGGVGRGGWAKSGKGPRRVQTSTYKKKVIISHGDVLYSTGALVNHIVWPVGTSRQEWISNVPTVRKEVSFLFLCDSVWGQTYRGDHFVVCTDFTSLGFFLPDI